MKKVKSKPNEQSIAYVWQVFSYSAKYIKCLKFYTILQNNALMNWIYYYINQADHYAQQNHKVQQYAENWNLDQYERA